MDQNEIRRRFLCDVGAALFGSPWQAQLGATLGVSDRTLRRWVAGDGDIPPGIVADLRGLLKARAAQVARLLASSADL